MCFYCSAIQIHGCPVSVQLAGFAMSLASDGLAADSQWSWHLQMVLPGRRHRADQWTCRDRFPGSPTATHCPSPFAARSLRTRKRVLDSVHRECSDLRRGEHWYVYRSLRTGSCVMSIRHGDGFLRVRWNPNHAVPQHLQRQTVDNRNYP
jgi:hypothetical protein